MPEVKNQCADCTYSPKEEKGYYCGYFKLSNIRVAKGYVCEHKRAAHKPKEREEG